MLLTLFRYSTFLTFFASTLTLVSVVLADEGVVVAADVFAATRGVPPPRAAQQYVALSYRVRPYFFGFARVALRHFRKVDRMT